MLEYLGTIETKGYLTVWDAIVDIVDVEVPAYLRQSVRGCPPGIFDLYLKRDGFKNWTGVVARRRKDSKVMYGAAFNKAGWLLDNRYIEINSYLAIGDRVAGDVLKGCSESDMISNEEYTSTLPEGTFDDGVALKFSGVCKVNFTDNEMQINFCENT